MWREKHDSGCRYANGSRYDSRFWEWIDSHSFFAFEVVAVEREILKGGRYEET